MEIPQRHGKRANPNTVFSLVQFCELAFYVKSFTVAYVLISRFFFTEFIEKTTQNLSPALFIWFIQKFQVSNYVANPILDVRIHLVSVIVTLYYLTINIGRNDRFWFLFDNCFIDFNRRKHSEVYSFICLTLL